MGIQKFSRLPLDVCWTSNAIRRDLYSWLSLIAHLSYHVPPDVLTGQTRSRSGPWSCHAAIAVDAFVMMRDPVHLPALSMGRRSGCRTILTVVLEKLSGLTCGRPRPASSAPDDLPSGCDMISSTRLHPHLSLSRIDAMRLFSTC